MFRQATLIQDVTLYRHSLAPWLAELITQHAHTGCVEEDVLEWVIAHQIEECYCVVIANHHRNYREYSELHDRLKHALPFALERLTRHLVKVPNIYGDQTLTLKLTRRDLYLHYHLDAPPAFDHHERKSRVSGHPVAGDRSPPDRLHHRENPR
ncbi:hypothetical protein HDG34_003271 [Paraburkholderia sp. HC6.4b]|uniref:hypothetical protein n=1 Tax=unclassified Paraburkholderia TaxID=2615204 RepID=UPI001616C283|nr:MULTISPECIES: hypothetical protein [unclassified Paraburkholderia]MBB5409330.1 hypothetical protein [Paraburkholderia sp. HC6.4b]MBB5451058.1 hypothetical protein [Paraburkholderia sp. Kb1A]